MSENQILDFKEYYLSLSALRSTVNPRTNVITFIERPHVLLP